MENTNLKELVIDGQPQRLGNRMVTYDGLVDFLEMLKHEIPRMGLNNVIPDDLIRYSYAFGKDNTITGTGECNVALGGSNTLSSAHYSFIHGFANDTQVHSDFDIFPSTSPLKGKSVFNYALGNKNKLFGNYNISIGLENQLYGNYSSIIGYSNIVHGTSCYVFGAGNDLQHNSSKNCYILGKENEIGSTAHAHENLYLFGNYAKIANAKNTKPLYYFGQYGEDASYEDNMIILANGTSSTNRNNLFQITYGGTIYDEYSDALYQKITTPASKQGDPDFALGHVRHSMVAMAGNEAEWLLTGRTSQEGATLFVNVRDHGYNTPKRIELHAGSFNAWAAITCGVSTCEKLYFQGNTKYYLGADSSNIVVYGPLKIAGSANESNSYIGKLSCEEIQVSYNASTKGPGKITCEENVCSKFTFKTNTNRYLDLDNTNTIVMHGPLKIAGRSQSGNSYNGTLSCEEITVTSNISTGGSGKITCQTLKCEDAIEAKGTIKCEEVIETFSKLTEVKGGMHSSSMSYSSSIFSGAQEGWYTIVATGSFLGQGSMSSKNYSATETFTALYVNNTLGFFNMDSLTWSKKVDTILNLANETISGLILQYENGTWTLKVQSTPTITEGGSYYLKLALTIKKIC